MASRIHTWTRADQSLPYHRQSDMHRSLRGSWCSWSGETLPPNLLLPKAYTSDPPSWRGRDWKCPGDQKAILGVSPTSHTSYWSHLNFVNAESLVCICEHLLPLPLDKLDKGFQIPAIRKTAIRPSFLLVLFKGLNPRGNSRLELHL